MVFAQDSILAHLETDDTLTSYYRVRPILSSAGDVRPDCLRLWPDIGCLRVVPDRAESADFRDRLRSLGEWCILDLSSLRGGSPKIRPNRSYVPGNGNRCQYIVYSDLLRPLADDPFFELLDAELSEISQAAAVSVTPRFFLRTQDAIYGPVDRTCPETGAPLAEIPELVSCMLPNGKTHTFVLCPSGENTQRNANTQQSLCEAMDQQLQAARNELAGLNQQIAASRRQLRSVQEQLLLHTPRAMAQRLETLRVQCNKAASRLSQLQNDIQTLSDKQRRLQRTVSPAQPRTGIHLTPVPGQCLGLDEVVSRVLKACSQAGFQADAARVTTALLLLGASPRVTIITPDPSGLCTALLHIVPALGWSSGIGVLTARENPLPVTVTPEDNATPAILLSLTKDIPDCPDACCVMITDQNPDPRLRSPEYQADPWPVLSLANIPSDSDFCRTVHPAVAADSLRPEVSVGLRPACQQLLAPVCASLQVPLTDTMLRFAAVAASWLPGGIPESVDLTLACFGSRAIPESIPADTVLQILEPYQLTRDAYLMRMREEITH